MAAPTWVSPKYETVWTNSTSPKTVSVTVAAGDALVVLAATENGDGSPVFTPSGVTGATWTSLRVGTSDADGAVAVLHTIVPTSGTYTLSVARTPASTNLWGFVALRFSGVTGVVIRGSSVNGAGTTWASSTTGANSALAWIAVDWNAVDGASRSYSTATAGVFTEQTYYRNSANYGVYAGFHPDAGAAGTKTVGLATPTGVLLTGISVEVQGPVASQTLAGTAVLASGASGSVARSTVASAAPVIASAQGAVSRSQISAGSPVVSNASGTVARSGVASVNPVVSGAAGTLNRSALAGVSASVISATGTVAPAASPGLAGVVTLISAAQGRVNVSQIAGSAPVLSGVQGVVSRSQSGGRAAVNSGAGGALARSVVSGASSLTTAAQGTVGISALAGISTAVVTAWGSLGAYDPPTGGVRTLSPVPNPRTLVPTAYTLQVTAIPRILLLTPVES